VALTGWQLLDPLIAIAVAANILWSGYRLVGRSVAGLMDAALPAATSRSCRACWRASKTQGVRFHAVRTRQAAARRFVSLHVLVPDEWTVRAGHDLVGTSRRRSGVPYRERVSRRTSSRPETRARSRMRTDAVWAEGHYGDQRLAKVGVRAGVVWTRLRGGVRRGFGTTTCAPSGCCGPTCGGSSSPRRSRALDREGPSLLVPQS